MAHQVDFINSTNESLRGGPSDHHHWILFDFPIRNVIFLHFPVVKDGKWKVEERHHNLNDEHTNYDVLFKFPSFPPSPNAPVSLRLVASLQVWHRNYVLFVQMFTVI